MKASSTVVTIASASDAVIKIRGILRMNAGGTLKPNIKFSRTIGGPATMREGSYIVFRKLGSGSVGSSGSVG